MQKRLDGKLAIVTGAGQGIGKAVALRLAREGADVVVADINTQNAEQTAEEIRSLDRRALSCPVDVSSLSKIQSMVDRAVAEFDRIDILVNAAGVAQTGLFVDLTEQQWDRVIDVNLKGTTLLCSGGRTPYDRSGAGARPYKSQSREDCELFFSLRQARQRAEQVAYAASKAAIISVTQSAALAFAPYNINVNAVCPGVVPTAMWEQIDRERGRIAGLAPGETMKTFIERTPLKRAGSADDVAGVVAFLCSPDSDYMTGQTLNVDGGFEMT